MSLDCHIISQKHCTAQSTPNDTKISAICKMLTYHKNTVGVRSRKAERRTEFKQEEMEERYVFLYREDRGYLGAFVHVTSKRHSICFRQDIVKIVSRNVSPKGAESVYSDLCPQTVRTWGF